ncbi:ABC-2 transporter permease [Neobacillus muris]|uniref:ABC-2 transporter permease n=1 Tax=Neobacillus muris TaxID=2941334 RepID=UPI0020402F98|nr:ABC-2 transporter permease [Neobacillus muris]
MFHLIKKDILVQKHALLISIALIIFFSISLSSLGPVGMTVGIITITYQLVLGASALEEKANSDIILISLPIKKHTMVLSKYLSVYVFAAYAILGFCLLYLIAQVLNLPIQLTVTPTAIAGSLVAITVLFSVSFPLIFKFGYIKSKIVNILILFVLIFGGTMTIGNLAQNEQSDLRQKALELIQEGAQLQIILLVLIPLALIFAASYFLSLRFYKNREF